MSFSHFLVVVCYSAYRLCRYQISKMRHYHALLRAFARLLIVKKFDKKKKEKRKRKLEKSLQSSSFARTSFTLKYSNSKSCLRKSNGKKLPLTKKFTTSWQLLAAACPYRYYTPSLTPLSTTPHIYSSHQLCFHAAITRITLPLSSISNAFQSLCYFFDLLSTWMAV